MMIFDENIYRIMVFDEIITETVLYLFPIVLVYLTRKIKKGLRGIGFCRL